MDYEDFPAICPRCGEAVNMVEGTCPSCGENLSYRIAILSGLFIFLVGILAGMYIHPWATMIAALGALWAIYSMVLAFAVRQERANLDRGR